MRLIFGLVLVVGMALAGFAVYMTKGYFQSYQAEAARLQELAKHQVPTVQVFVAARKVMYGEQLEKKAVKLVRWPINSLPEGIFTYEADDVKGFEPGEDLFPENSDKLRSVLRTMEIGEPIIAVKVTKPGMTAGISSRLSPGMRAFAIKVDATSGVGGALRPGHKVDVYWTGKAPGNPNMGRQRAKITKLIESGMTLVAIDQSANDDISGTNIARTITVEATPRQVAALAQAQSSGRLSLSLVGVGDASALDPIEMSQLDLLGIEATEAPVVQEKKICTIKTRKGGKMEVIEIPCTN